jgi:hypothetical protein
MHEMWGWRAAARSGDVTRAVAAIAEKSGLEKCSDVEKGTVFLRVINEKGGAIVLGSGMVGDELARELCRSLKVKARFAKVQLSDAQVSATAVPIAADGKPGANENLDELARETCEEWHEGKKYKSESLEPLVGICLDVEGDLPDGGTELVYARSGSVRVNTLVDAVRGGAKWEPTQVGGRPAVRVVDGKGTRISVLSPDEMKAFEASVAEKR